MSADVERYARQRVLDAVGDEGQRRLHAARVLVVGAGGLGCPVLQYLVGAGVGEITVVDPDTVSLSNLHRQVLYREHDIDEPKADIAARELKRLNSSVTVHPVVAALDPANAADWVAASDLVLDCADSMAVTYTLSDQCLAAGTPLVSASALALTGYVGGFCAGAPSVRAVFPNAPESLANCNEAGVLGPVVGVLGALQAQTALAVLLGDVDTAMGRLLRLDATTLRFSEMRFIGAPEPQAVHPFVSVTELIAADRVVELRDAVEAPLSVRADVERWSLDDIAQLTPAASGQRTVFCCHSGLRAWRAADRVASFYNGPLALLAAGSLNPLET